MRICNKAISLCQKGDYFVIETDAVPIHIWFLTDDIVRIRAGFEGDFAEESYVLMMTGWKDRMDSLFGTQRRQVKPQLPELNESDDEYSLCGRKLRVVIEKSAFSIRIYDKEGTCLHADIADLSYMEDSNKRRIHTSEISPADCFYGFGEKTGEINKAQQFMSMSPGDALGYDPQETDSLYKHIPFYIKLNRDTHKASGYFYHNTYECDFNMGREKRNYWKNYSRYRTDGGDIDLFFIAGPAVKAVIRRYTDLTGKSAMLPRYALGYLGSSMYYPELQENCDDAILDFIDTTKEEKIPIDGFQLSSGYTVQKNNKRCVFTWNHKRFKEPATFFSQMGQRGVTVSPNVKPGFLLSHPLLEELKEKDVFVKNADGKDCGEGTWWGGKGVFFDFTLEKNRCIWKEYLKKYVLDLGVSSVWNDNCEYDSIVDKDDRVGFEGKGSTIGHLKAVMSNLMCKISDEAIRETSENIRPYIVCRSGYSGIQQYAQTWAGDNLTCWEALKYNIATILGMGVSGVANHGCDIGGFFGPAPSAELFVRWIQNGIFQPRFSIHSTNTDNTVTEPWMYSNYKDLIRQTIQFRYQLMPYLYTLMERAHEEGLPIIQPMFSVFQQDSACYDEGIDFMLGESLLVANVVEEKAKTRKIYLPKNEVFYDFYTREKYTGGQTIELAVDITSIPLFIRGGSILPIAVNELHNLHTQQATDLKLMIAPDKDTVFTLYEDDGMTLDYKKKMYCKTKIDMKVNERVLLKFSTEGNYTTAIKKMVLDVIHQAKAPYWIMKNKEVLPHYLHRSKFEAADHGWYYSQRLKSVQIKYLCPKEDYEVAISFEQFDLLGM